MGKYFIKMGEPKIIQPAFLFPGQGSQKVGMGLDLFNNTEIGNTLYHQANNILEMDIADISFNGPDEILKQTENTQPALFIQSVIIAELLRENNVLPSVVTGHSLGEFSALVCAGYLSFEDGLKLVKIRSREMSRACKINPGTMAAIIGLDQETVTQICHDVSSSGIVQPANFNSQNQIVISGDISAVKEAMNQAKDKGALKTVELNVSGPFHSPLMNPAKNELNQFINDVELSGSEVPIYMNYTGEPTNASAEIKENIIQQLENPVKWVQTIQNMINSGVEEFHEVGAGKVLKGLNRRIDRTTTTTSIETIDDINQFTTV